MGAVLSQLDDEGKERPLAFANKSLSLRERNYSAIVYAVRQLQVYLLGKSFRLVTDHMSLKWLHSMEPKC